MEQYDLDLNAYDFDISDIYFILDPEFYNYTISYASGNYIIKSCHGTWIIKGNYYELFEDHLNKIRYKIFKNGDSLKIQVLFIF